MAGRRQGESRAGGRRERPGGDDLRHDAAGGEAGPDAAARRVEMLARLQPAAGCVGLAALHEPEDS